MRKLIAAAVIGGLAPLALTIPARAETTGAMSYDPEYKEVFKGEINGVVKAFCGCTGEAVSDGDGRDWTRLNHYAGGVCGCQDAYVEFGDKDGDGEWHARWKEFRGPTGVLLDSTYWFPKYP